LEKEDCKKSGSKRRKRAVRSLPKERRGNYGKEARAREDFQGNNEGTNHPGNGS